MSKGTKHAGDWKETTLQVAINALRLTMHTRKIMANPKVFNPAYCTPIIESFEV